MVQAARGGRYAAALAILSVVALLVTPFYFERKIDDQRAIVTGSIDPARENASDVRLALAREVGAIRGFLLTRDTSLLREYLVARDSEEIGLRALQKLSGLDSGVRETIASLVDQAHAWNAANDRLARRELPIDSALRLLPSQLERYRIALDAGEKLENEVTAAHQRIRDEVLAIEHRWTTASVILAILAAAAAAVVIRILAAATRESALARTDPLTALFNRRGFGELAERELSRARRNATPISLLSFDLDGFKVVNDTAGHAAGDRLLQSVAAGIREAIRDIDVGARLGGDEFAILLPDNRANPPERAVERIRDVILRRLAQDGHTITLSIGAVTLVDRRMEVDELIHEADTLMYKVKNSGKNAIRHQALTAPATIS